MTEYPLFKSARLPTLLTCACFTAATIHSLSYADCVFDTANVTLSPVGSSFFTGVSPHENAEILTVGDIPGVPAALTVDNGASVTGCHSLAVGIFDESADGSLTISNQGFFAVGGGADIGHTGIGNLAISGGGIFRSSAGPVPTAGSFFGNRMILQIGAYAGSNGFADVSDPGSRLESVLGINVGRGGVDSAVSVPDPNAPATGSLYVQNGAEVRTLFMNIG